MVVSSLSLLYAQENNEGERPVMIEKENEQELSSNPLSNIFQKKAMFSETLNLHFLYT